jgi:2-phospho-L-lactate guanylyltransferase
MPPVLQSWAFVVPVKRLPAAKTRLSVPADLRAQLALAMAVDTVTAAVETGALVVVVTDDQQAADALRRTGAHVVADAPDAGLNPALRHGAEMADAMQPRSRIAAMSSDLPAVDNVALLSVLGAAESTRAAVVADAAGTGTTLLAAEAVDVFAPAFGADSRRRHIEIGAVDLTDVADPRVRRDVDTLADLVDAWGQRCGAATSALVRAHPELVHSRLQ